MTFKKLDDSVEKNILPEGEKSLEEIKETIIRCVFTHAQHNHLDETFLNDLVNLKNVYSFLSSMKTR